MDFSETETMRTQKDEHSRHPRYACKGGGRRRGDVRAGGTIPRRATPATINRLRNEGFDFRPSENNAKVRRDRENAAKLTADEVRDLESAADTFDFKKVRPILTRIGVLQKGQRISNNQIGYTVRSVLDTAKDLGK